VIGAYDAASGTVLAISFMMSGVPTTIGGSEARVRLVPSAGHGFREGGELHSLSTKFVDLSHDLVDRSLAAIENGTQLDRCRFDSSHRILLVRRVKPARCSE
jgi:hypothetical protein